MDPWPQPIADASHHHPNLLVVCEEIRRLEAAADRKFNSTPEDSSSVALAKEDPTMRAKLDTAQRAQLLADRNAGMTIAQLATKYNVSPSTAAYWCRRLNGATPAEPKLSERSTVSPEPNGEPTPPASVMKHNTSELEQVLLDAWSRLSLADRARLLLNRA